MWKFLKSTRKSMSSEIMVISIQTHFPARVPARMNSAFPANVLGDPTKRDAPYLDLTSIQAYPCHRDLVFILYAWFMQSAAFVKFYCR